MEEKKIDRRPLKFEIVRDDLEEKKFAPTTNSRIANGFIGVGQLISGAACGFFAAVSPAVCACGMAQCCCQSAKDHCEAGSVNLQSICSDDNTDEGSLGPLNHAMRD